MTHKTPTIHMLFGFVGSGKTTFARKLEGELRAVRFSHDEWMVALYGTNPPAELFDEYYHRIARLIEAQYKRLLEIGVDVIIDSRFWRRAGRDAIRQLAASHGADIKLYALECPEDEMLERVLARNERLGTEGSVFIDRNAFEMLKTRVEPLGDDEVHIRVNTSKRK